MRVEEVKESCPEVSSSNRNQKMKEKQRIFAWTGISMFAISVRTSMLSGDQRPPQTRFKVNKVPCQSFLCWTHQVPKHASEERIWTLERWDCGMPVGPPQKCSSNSLNVLRIATEGFISRISSRAGREIWSEKIEICFLECVFGGVERRINTMTKYSKILQWTECSRSTSKTH